MYKFQRLFCFKKKLFRFFYNKIEDQIYAPIIFLCVNGKLYWENVDELYGYHLEAHIRIAFHAKHADINDPGETVLRANDTDIAIIL